MRLVNANVWSNATQTGSKVNRTVVKHRVAFSTSTLSA